jgi:hypothetical protein
MQVAVYSVSFLSFLLSAEFKRFFNAGYYRGCILILYDVFSLAAKYMFVAIIFDVTSETFGKVSALNVGMRTTDDKEVLLDNAKYLKDRKKERKKESLFIFFSQ